MTDYGVQPTGFVRKPLSVILAEIEAAAMTQFGTSVIQTPQSPLGQLNGLFADYASQLWEMAEHVYQSYDPEQAEGNRLDTLGRLRLLSRNENEGDEDYRLAVTNNGRARIDIQDLSRAIAGLDGVTFVQVYINDTGELDENNLLPGTLAIAVIGGDDDEIAAAMRKYIVPGISTSGNTRISSTIEGFCRSFSVIRPTPVPLIFTITVRRGEDRLGCPAPSPSAIANSFVANMATLLNGEDITFYRVRQAIESQYSNVEVVSFVGEREGTEYALNTTVPIDFREIGTVAIDDVTMVDA